ncbi:BsuPI-related putative proteinase inhibitor [Aquibacillus kalidii]|uniref:BsuPI-related putative proteinase inhibitor n=1 Tax=Aquibacillus kalidii TaxID=2762597 RepID=UPI001647FFFE|nr:BsuPI-related putative proteinase inhibitor [Aquibacillus kalidii]
MKKTLFLFSCCFMLIGCGTGENTKEDVASEVNGAKPDQEIATDDDSAQENQGIVAGEMEASLTETSPLTYTYKVTNQTEKEVKLKFTSSQRYDFSVRNQAGEQVYLFSSLASFLQVLGEETIKQGESLEYTIDLSNIGLKTGDYVLTAWMTPEEGEKYSATTKVVIP